MHHPYQLAIAITLAIIAETAIMLPFARFLTTGWFAKRRDILDGLSGSACRAYFACSGAVKRRRKGRSAPRSWQYMTAGGCSGTPGSVGGNGAWLLGTALPRARIY